MHIVPGLPGQPTPERWAPWSLDYRHHRLVHRTTEHAVDLGEGFDHARLVQVLHDVTRQPWANAVTVGALLLALDDLVHLEHLRTYGRRARQPLRREVWLTGFYAEHPEQQVRR